jgi:serine/threonine-protein kinase
MPVAVCPKPETLASFARGALAAEELAAVAGHVGSCAACCRALQLVPEDSLAGLARAAAAAPSTVNSVGAPAPGASTGTPADARVPVGFVDHPRYRIVSELGAGGMGTVYKAEDQLMGRVVALKVVSSHLTAKASAVARFRKEVRATAQLQHQNIITTHDTGEAGGAQFLVMEFIEGVSLDRLVAKKGPLPVPMACMFTRQAALGLQHAADKGMVHRDIKPQNLMVTRKGQVKILDFGLARFASTDDPEEPAPNGKLPFGAGKAAQNAGVTNPNLLMGTPDYLSPEQAKNSHDVDPRSDIYSLGCTLYFLLTGKPPFVTAPTLIDKLLAHTHDEPPAIREERFEVTGELADVLAKMMAKRPEDRYQTAKEAADALLPFTRSDAAKEPHFEIVEAVAVTPAPVLVATPVATPAPAAEVAFDTDPQPNSPTLVEFITKPKKKKAKKRGSWWQRRKWAVLGGAAALVLLVGVVIAASKKPAGGAKETPPDPAAAGAKAGPKAPPAKADSPKADKGDKANPWVPPTVIAPPRGGAKVLYVLPSEGVWLHDYAEARKRLESLAVTVVTASTDGGTSKPHPDLPGEPVPIDVKFTATMDLSEYAAVVFAGFFADEYIFFGKGSAAAARAIKQMQAAGKPVAAICLGQAVLAAHGALKGKRAAHCQPMIQRHPYLTNDKSGIIWDAPGVTTDRSESNKLVVTASGGRESVQFADAVFAAIRAK